MPRQHIISYHITSSRPPPLNLSLSPSLSAVCFSQACAQHTHTHARRRAQIENSKSWPFVRRDLDAALIYLFLFVGCRAVQNRARHHVCGFVRVGVGEWPPLFYGGLHICRALCFSFLSQICDFARRFYSVVCLAHVRICVRDGDRHYLMQISPCAQIADCVSKGWETNEFDLLM